MTGRLAGWMMMLIIGFYAGPGMAGWNPKGGDEAEKAIAEFRKADPGLKVFFDKAYGYAVFPTVGKAGISVGGQKFSFTPR